MQHKKYYPPETNIITKFYYGKDGEDNYVYGNNLKHIAVYPGYLDGEHVTYQGNDIALAVVVADSNEENHSKFEN